uniref:Nucleoplasmin-like domain-containing protein n=2 Tax=Kalanchoe fedtschenkoi TaxID=63787 RepID=A0A7N0TMB9_KALFE
MEFWGVEVKAGQPLKVSPGEGKVIHLSQASIGESRKDESVPVYVKVDEQKLVIGTLSADKHPQMQCCVFFEKDFELSHNWKNGSVFFCGYRCPDLLSGDDSDSGSEEEELPLENGKSEPAKAAASKPEAAANPKVKVNVEEASKDAKAGSDEDSSDDEDFSGSDDEDLSDDSDEKMGDGDSDDEDSSEEDEKAPTRKKENKKRPYEIETKTPFPSEKAKLATPRKSGGKKATAHTATPHPSKQTGKTPKNSALKAKHAGK